MSFLDEDELDPAPSGPGGRRVPDRQRQLFMRRVIALGVGVLILILLLLGVRGCLNARAERGFENYVSDLGSIVTQSEQLSRDFFGRLLDPPQGLTELNLEAQIASDRGTAESLLQRVEGLDVPDDLADAHTELVQAFELRRDGLAGIASDIPNALTSEGRAEAIAGIAGDMQAFLASDVLYARANADIATVLSTEEIENTLPPVVPFVSPPADRWLDESQLVLTLNTFALETGNVPEGDHGLVLINTTIDRTDLSVDFENTVELGNDPPEITVEVQNGGDTEERDVSINYAFSGGSTPVEGQVSIPNIDAQGVEEATVPLEAVPETEVALTLEVEALAVLGETVVDNNAATYTVTFN